MKQKRRNRSETNDLNTPLTCTNPRIVCDGTIFKKSSPKINKNKMVCALKITTLLIFSNYLLHPFLQFAHKHFGDVGAERVVRWPQKTGPGAVAHLRPALHDVDERRRDVLRRAAQLRQHRAQRGTAAHRLKVLGAEAGLTLEGVMSALRAYQRTDEGEPVGDGGDLRQQFGNLQAGNLGGCAGTVSASRG